jgi:hypothetical protein
MRDVAPARLQLAHQNGRVRITKPGHSWPGPRWRKKEAQSFEQLGFLYESLPGHQGRAPK